MAVFILPLLTVVVFAWCPGRLTFAVNFLRVGFRRRFRGAENVRETAQAPTRSIYVPTSRAQWSQWALGNLSTSKTHRPPGLTPLRPLQVGISKNGQKQLRGEGGDEAAPRNGTHFCAPLNPKHCRDTEEKQLKN